MCKKTNPQSFRSSKSGLLRSFEPLLSRITSVVFLLKRSWTVGVCLLAVVGILFVLPPLAGCPDNGDSGDGSASTDGNGSADSSASSTGSGGSAVSSIGSAINSTSSSADSRTNISAVLQLITNVVYERETDNGKVETSNLYLPLPEGVSVDTSYFNTSGGITLSLKKLTNQIAREDFPLTISGLMHTAALQVTLREENGRITQIEIDFQFQPKTHQRGTDNFTVNLTLHSNLFVVSENYFASDVSLIFEVKFGSFDSFWSPRSTMVAVVHDHSIWVMGGNLRTDGVVKSNDVWKSEDGSSWQLIQTNAAWSERADYTALSYEDSLYVLGGAEWDPNEGDIAPLNDVWSTTNGSDWTSKTDNAAWSDRDFHGAAVHNGEMWIMGGSGGSNTIYRSADGVTWTQVPASNHWSSRRPNVVVHRDALWVIGANGANNTNDVWTSRDGTNWNLVAETSAWPSRSLPAIVSHADALWLMGGNHNTNPTNDIWTSPGGTNWTEVNVSGDHWDGRNAHRAVVFNGRIFVMGGRAGSADILNDIWSSSDGVEWKKENPPFQY